MFIFQNKLFLSFSKASDCKDVIKPPDDTISFVSSVTVQCHYIWKLQLCQSVNNKGEVHCNFI